MLQLVIGLPYPALMAFIAFVITLVPLFGSVIFLVIGTLAALLSSPEQALIFGIAYLIYIQIESYVVTPRVMTKAIAIPAALVLIGAMVGGTLGGVIGVLVALPVMAIDPAGHPRDRRAEAGPEGLSLTGVTGKSPSSPRGCAERPRRRRG